MGKTYINRHTPFELKLLQGLPLDIKIAKTKLRIRECVDFFGLDRCAVSFSGGKDSTVLLHIARQIYPDIRAVFCDTGLEFPETRAFALETENLDVVRPKLNFREVIEKCGYPVVSKEAAVWIYRLRHYKTSEEKRVQILTGVMPDGRKTRFYLAKKWQHLLGAPFKIGSGCCRELKKKPFAAYARRTGRDAAIVGTMAGESKLRTQVWLRQGCNAFDAAHKISAPMSFWNERDVWDYIRQNDLRYSPIYDMGYERTGCVFCAFGIQFDGSPNRFQKLKRTHPRLWQYCVKPKSEGGLGLGGVLDFMGIPYGNEV